MLFFGARKPFFQLGFREGKRLLCFGFGFVPLYPRRDDGVWATYWSAGLIMDSLRGWHCTYGLGKRWGGNKVYREVTLGMAVSVGSLDSVNEYFRGYVLPMS